MESLDYFKLTVKAVSLISYQGLTKKHGLLDKVSVIQIGWHSYGEIGLGARAWQLCEIRNMLAETHTMTWGLAFGWERWELKDGA